MPDQITIFLNGRELSVPPGTTVAAASLQAGELHFRTSVTGVTRAPLCGIGICFECRLIIDGRAHSRSCQVMVRQGMRVCSQ